MEYIEACCRVQDCCEPRTARGPVPVSRCALGCSLLLVLVALRPSAIADSGSPISSPASNTIPALVLTNALSDQTVLGFDKLAGYPLKLTEELQSNTNRVAWADSQVNAMIPESIRKLDGQRVFIEGFMLPIAYEQDHLSEFILVRDMPGCCYGFPPNPHEWVKGVVKAPKFRVEIDHPVRVHGVFHVGAERSGGYLSSIYRLDADAVADPPIK